MANNSANTRLNQHSRGTLRDLSVSSAGEIEMREDDDSRNLVMANPNIEDSNPLPNSFLNLVFGNSNFDPDKTFQEMEKNMIVVLELAKNIVAEGDPVYETVLNTLGEVTDKINYRNREQYMAALEFSKENLNPGLIESYSLATQALVEHLLSRSEHNLPNQDPMKSGWYVVLLENMRSGFRYLGTALTKLLVAENDPVSKQDLQNTINATSRVKSALYALMQRVYFHFSLETMYESLPENKHHIIERGHMMCFERQRAKEIILADFRRLNLVMRFWVKLDAMESSQVAFDNNPDKPHCSDCCEDIANDPNQQFAILDGCNHLICVDCITNNYTEPWDSFCPSRNPGCNEQIDYYILRVTFDEYKTAWGGMNAEGYRRVLDEEHRRHQQERQPERRQEQQERQRREQKEELY